MNTQISEQEILNRIQSDHYRMQILSAAKEVNLPEWCIAAGFVRNLVWDYLHGYESSTPVKDIDLVYFDKQNLSEEKDRILEKQLTKSLSCNWSVKNQARMHWRNQDEQYKSTLDAMSYWPEIETAIGVTICQDRLQLVTPFSLEEILSNTVTLNPKRPKLDVLTKRAQEKGWLQRWPLLAIRTATN